MIESAIDPLVEDIIGTCGIELAFDESHALASPRRSLLQLARQRRSGFPGCNRFLF
jgi:hypothetical protein